MLASKTKIIRIGNSQGVRIPRSLLEQAGVIENEGEEVLGREVELEVEEEGILIRLVRQARAGWDEQFREMAEQGDETPSEDVPQASSRIRRNGCGRE